MGQTSVTALTAASRVPIWLGLPGNLIRLCKNQNISTSHKDVNLFFNFSQTRVHSEIAGMQIAIKWNEFSYLMDFH